MLTRSVLPVGYWSAESSTPVATPRDWFLELAAGGRPEDGLFGK